MEPMPTRHVPRHQRIALAMHGDRPGAAERAPARSAEFDAIMAALEARMARLDAAAASLTMLGNSMRTATQTFDVRAGRLVPTP